MKQHVTIVGYLYIVLGALYVLAALIVGVILLGSGLIAVNADPHGGAEALGILAIIAIVVGVLLVVLGLPGIIAGLGLLKFNPWARILALVLAVLNVLSFPIGTAIAVYTFWALLNNEAERLFVSGGAV